MGDAKFQGVNQVPKGKRIEVILGSRRTNIGAWWMDNMGTIGHNCLHEMDCNAFPAWLSKVGNGYNPIKGKFHRFCMTCGVDAPDEVFEFAELRKFGDKIRGKK